MEFCQKQIKITQDKIDKLNTDLHQFMTEKVLNIDYVKEKITQKRFGIWKIKK